MTTEKFSERHIGPREHELPVMLKTIGVDSLDEMIEKVMPDSIRLKKQLNLQPAMTEYQYLKYLRKLGSMNKQLRSFIGQGYYGVSVPSVIIRNVLENPSWYSSYTPYQAEISQGRLEALLNFQTVIIELTGMEVANASLLDESTAAAEAMIMMFNTRSKEAVKINARKFFVDEDIFLQTMDVLKTRSAPLGIEIVTGRFDEIQIDSSFFGALVQYPSASGEIHDYKDFAEKVHSSGALLGVAADLMSLAILVPPGEWGADIVVGSTQRFGLPMSYGGPHAGFFASKDEFKRNMPGRIIGVSIDSNGDFAIRMALQTREQHIKRERATSNICTSQALLAIMSGMFAQYHGPKGLKRIAWQIHSAAYTLSEELKKSGFENVNNRFFDTVKIILPSHLKQAELKQLAIEAGMNFWYPDEKSVSISTDEITTIEEVNQILSVFAIFSGRKIENVTEFLNSHVIEKKFKRQSEFLKESVFNMYHSETAMMRYIKMLERKDISLTHCMISLGSCTMKLSSATSMFAMSWPEFANIHPFVPAEQAEGYHKLIDELGNALKEITGFPAISFMPNSGAAGEYTGLLIIRRYHQSRGEEHRNVALIPSSAHGTNPASAVMAGMKVVVVECDENGNISVDDLRKKAEDNRENLSCFMITYPSTHGVFEEAIIEMVKIIHENGGLVYMDGANLNAQAGLTSPGLIGADVCHLNLHKTFGIPHGGGGPGVGPILVNEKLADFLPRHPVINTGGRQGITAVAGAPFGSAHILTIAHAYIRMMGAGGLTDATKYAILNANYISASLKGWFKTLYTGKNGMVAHEMILDCREFRNEAGVTELDIAKRLMDYGFHAPTLSFPVHGTLMVEPTESEPLQELDKFIAAMKSIRNEIKEIAEGKASKEDNVLKNAPFTQKAAVSDEWKHDFSRKKAAFPAEWLYENKFWPAVGRIDDGYGDRNFMCTCIPIDKQRQETLKTFQE